MAAKRTNTQRKADKEKLTHTCGECANAYDFHEIGADGKPFLCRCPFYTNGQFCRFIDEKQCEQHFKPRNNAKD